MKLQTAAQRLPHKVNVDDTVADQDLERGIDGLNVLLPSLPVENSKIVLSTKPACVFRLRAS